MSTSTTDAPKLPPAWFEHAFWHVHRLLHRLSGGRFLWTPNSKRGWGAARLTTTGRQSGQRRTVTIGYIEDDPNLVTRLLTTRGFRSGRRHTVPMAPVDSDGRRWLAARYGAVTWVHNVRESGEVSLRHGRATRECPTREVSAEEAGPVLKRHLAVATRRAQFKATYDSPVEDCLGTTNPKSATCSWSTPPRSVTERAAD